MWYSERNFRIF